MDKTAIYEVMNYLEKAFMIQLKSNALPSFVMILCFLFLFTNDLKAQTKPTDNQRKIDSVSIDKLPEFPGGIDSLHNYLSHSIVYPNEAQRYKAEGTIYIFVIVDTTGKLRNIKVKKDEVGHNCAIQAISAVMAMPPWHPAEKNGRQL